MIDQTKLQDYIAKVEAELGVLLPEIGNEESPVRSAMRYSCEGGGKRIRPVLLLESCALCGGDVNDALPFACALEMIHTYSLIHDDLPCMDNDDLRRGKPSCHKQFGEAFALLAGDALLTRAFSVCADSAFAKKEPQKAVHAISLLANAAGDGGMIGGQEIDLLSEGEWIPVKRLAQMDRLKTGALIKAACEIGAVIGGADPSQIESLGNYASSLGMAFQIVDDILDVEGDADTLGKPIGSDAKSDKSTYVSLLGLKEAKRLAAHYTDEAVAALERFGENAAFLRELAIRLGSRTA